MPDRGVFQPSSAYLCVQCWLARVECEVTGYNGILSFLHVGHPEWRLHSLQVVQGSKAKILAP